MLKKEGHVVIDSAISRLSPRAQSMLHVFNSVICALACLLLTWNGAKVTRDLILSAETAVSVLEPQKWILMLIVPIGSFLLVIQFIIRAFDYFRRWKEPPEHLEIKIKQEL